MTIPRENLFLVLKFHELDALEQIVVYAENGFDPPLRFIGKVNGKEKLEDLLVTVGIDHVVTRFGDDNFRSASQRSAKQIADGLERDFELESEITRKMLMTGGKELLTDPEQPFTAPKSLSVCSSSVRSDIGLSHAQRWFAKNK